MVMDDRAPPARQRTTAREIHPRPQREVVSEALKDLHAALTALKAYGVHIPVLSRIDQAIEVLEHALATGDLIPAARGDSLGLQALELAFDYSAIATTLPPLPLAAVRRELRDSLRGSLDSGGPDKTAVQLQAQFVVRAGLVRGGLAPTHPTHSTNLGIPSPDLLLEKGNSTYAVEVKRPQFERNVIPRLRAARDQLDGFGSRGAVILDVTDCVRGMSPKDIDAEVRRLAIQVYGEVFEDNRGYRPGYSSIMVAGILARAGWAADHHEDEAQLDVHTSSSIAVFAKVPNTLLDHHGRWIREHLQDGLEQLYRTIGESRHPRLEG